MKQDKDIMKRLTIDMSEKAHMNMQGLMVELDIKTYKELFDNMYTLTKWAISQRKKGYEIGAYDEEKDTFYNMLMPCLQSIEKEKQ